MKVLIIGSGGREHCLTWKMSQSPLVDKIFCAPGNGGTSLLAHNINISVTDLKSLRDFALKENIGLTVAGPEVPLVSGIVDEFEAAGLNIFGPDEKSSLLEGSKIFAKEVMKKYGIPTADFKVFDNPGSARKYAKDRTTPCVVKADGLAAGKGVLICKNKGDVLSAIDTIMVSNKFGEAGRKIIIEDFLEGEELSILTFTDGNTILPLIPSQDHKAVFDGDKGPNTGGMGAYAPAPLADKAVMDKALNKIFIPLIEGLREDGIIYKGVLYAGIMIVDGEPYVLEFNVRFGDPETQVTLPKLKGDLPGIMLKVLEGKLKDINLLWDNKFYVCVVLTSGGYPGIYEKGKSIKGLDKFKDLNDILIFHAGTKRILKDSKDLSFITNGGRVLNVVGLGNDINDARFNVYKAVNNISFDNMHYRKDIGSKALKFFH